MMNISTHWRYLALVSFLLTTYFSYAVGRNLNVTTVRLRQKRQQGAELYLPSTFVIPGGEGGPGWGAWGSPSPCSRSCGGGVSKQSRRCEDVEADGRPRCRGGDSKYFSCNTQDCPENSLDFRSLQCSHYDSTPFEGVTYEWVPYTKAPNPCELNCMPRGERFYYRHDNKVADGTPCNEESLDVCVNGECLPVGCDMMLGSNAREDNCRQCGGDGSSCKTTSGVYDKDDLTVGYNDILLIPQGATNIVITEQRPSNNYLAIRNKAGDFYLNGNWRIDFPRAFTFAGAIWHYERKPQGFAAPDSIRCLGPTSEPVYLVILYQSTNVGISYEYSVPQGIAHSTDDEYAWVYDAFTHCSASCGGGFQVRNVTCASQRELTPVDDSLCDAALRPAANQSCADIACAARWVESEWDQCSQPCGDQGVQSRQIYCQKIVTRGLPSVVSDEECFQLLGPKPPQHQKCNVGQPCPDWHVGPWYPCDKLCGEGKQRRNVRCYRKVDGKIEVLDDDQCAQEKPEKEKSCFIHPCDGVDWVLSDWSGCDSCLSKVKTRSAHCATQKGEVFPDSFCSNHPEPELQADCDAALLPACDVQWYTSQWSKCSGKCGDGVKSRRVFCGLFNGEALQKVANDRCEAPEKPEDTQPCELDEDKKDCPAEWHAGPFSECSKPCGGGEQARKVLCLRENKTVPITECDESNILEQTQQCNKEACDDDEILPMEVGSTQPVTDYEEEEWCDDEDYDDESDGVTSAMDESATETTLDDLMMSDGPSYTEVTGSGDYEETSIADGSGDALSTYIPEVDTSVDFTDDGSGDETTPSEESTTSGSSESTSSDVDLTSSSSDSSSSESSTDSGISTESSSTDESSTDLSSTESTDASSSTDISSTDSSSESSTDSSSESTDSTPIDSSTDSSSTDNASTDVSSTDGASTDASSTDDSSTDVSSTDASSTDVSSEGSSTDDSSTEASSTDSSSTDASSTDISSTDGSSTDSSSTDSSSTDSSSTDSSSTDSSSTDSSSTDSSSTDISSTDSSSEATTDITTESSTDGGTTTEEDGLRVGEFDPESSITKATTDESSTDTSESTSEGSTDSSTDGSTDSSTDGSTDSSTDVSTDGSTDSSTDGSTDSSTDGSTDSSTDGSTDNSTDGSTDATSESSTDSSSSTEDSSTIESSTYDGLTTEISSTDSSSTEESSTDASTDQSSTEESTSESSTSESSSDSSESSSEMSTDSGYSTTEETESSSSAWGWSLSTLGQTKEKKCKRRPKKACLTSQFGCCFDNKTAATGPFEKGCPNPKTCKETKHGCCPDGVSPAQGADGKGCPLLACNETLFGCCSDKKSAAQGNNQEDCPPPCKSSKFGCCADGKQEAEGPKKKGCPESIVATTVAPTVHCSKGKHGCCEDNSTAATGPSKAGCPCSTTQHGCCPDQQSAATGPNLEGCVFACSSATFGCCPDRETAAHGPNGEGCCITQPFGCCPDNIVAARGPEFEGCGCQWSPYGCCPGNETAARGYNNEGCGCQHTPHGCCPNRYTPALGPKFEGCPCHTYQFGCCPDGKQVARGPRAQGCGCKDSEFGCCSDDQTPAGGPDKAGCDCAASKFGCCPDGQAEATGEEFAGCEDKPENLQAVCGMEKDRGSCRNYTVKWYYDLEYGGCSRFWYGGCDGNNNRFRSQEECKDVCVQPVGRDACKLPKVKGPCEGYYPTWYFDSERKQCGQFIYGGCLGNNNRFQTREECQKQCDKVAEQDVCSLKTERGQCAGAFTRWSFNADSRSCQPFNWGGCEGNANRFISESACILQCDTPGKMKDACLSPRSAGNCTQKIPKWFFDREENRCMPFYYTGCEGNDNQFDSEAQCEEDCPKVIVQDICTLPSVTGECAEYKERWFYDSAEKRCRQFYYGGCGGNSNNFPSEQECETRCSDQEVTTTVQPVETYGTEICFLRVDTRPCTDSSPRWHYDSTDGVCKQFLWGSCQQRNHNTFSSRAECESFCSSVQDLCQLPMAVGPCDASLTQWFYDKHSDACSQFAYGGCQGNNNRFGSKSECEQRCKQGPSETTEDSNAITPVTHRPEDILAEICREPMVSGNCSERLPVWAYDEATGKCTNFLYSGCNGNRNRFLSEEQCQRHCGQFRGIEVCRYGKEEGPCRGRFVKFYFEEQRGQCLEFIWGGCAGGPNRFSSEAECSAVCREHRELPPDSATTSEEVCNQQVDSGNCEGPYFRRWYYSNEHGTCLAFIYTGCGGNSNNFKSMDACMRQCRQPSETNEINTDSDNEITDAPAPTQDPCRAYKDHCAGLQCNYGLARSLQSDGCERCSCVDPCDNMRCENGGRCVIGNYRDQNSGEIVYYPECRLENKPGQCPQDNTVDENAIAPSEERCENECRSDVDCRGDDKCCRRGCGVVCLAPHRESLPAYTIEPRWDSDVEPTGVQPPRIDESEDPEVFAEEGNIAVLRCLVYGNPAPTITWKKESIIIDGTSGRHRIMTDGALQIISLYRNDSGVYICVADNGIGPAVQREINLEVNVPVTVNITVPQSTYPVGSDLSLLCDVEGYPLPEVSWLKDGYPLSVGGRVAVSESNRLTVYRVNTTDSGEYRCSARNLYSSAYSSVTISVEGLYIHPNCTDNPFFANCKLIVQAHYCSHRYYARFCCRSCTEAGLLPSYGNHLA